VIRCADLKGSSLFYHLLGLSFVKHRHGQGPEHLSAELGGVVFELYPQTAEGSTTRGVRLGFEVLSLENLITALDAWPGSVISPPQDSLWGRRAVITDPDGHRVELVEALA
jgi:lactoylglutathione lyase